MNPEARIILASGYSISADVVQLLSTGGVEFLQKPFSAEEMVRKIDAAMGRVP
jgi:DNA-binding response OmpR family regulator